MEEGELDYRTLDDFGNAQRFTDLARGEQEGGRLCYRPTPARRGRPRINWWLSGPGGHLEVANQAYPTWLAGEVTRLMLLSADRWRQRANALNSSGTEGDGAAAKEAMARAKALKAWADRSRSAPRIAAMLRLASGLLAE